MYYTVLITGESGIGKRMFAQSVHNESLRKNNPYVMVNCAGMPPDQLDNKLYGYLETNYIQSSSMIKKGMFEVAHTGTIFLDQISKLDIHGQASLLRVLTEGNIVRRGDDRALPVNIRIICSTNKNLMNLVREGEFNENLYYMLNVLSLNLTPLRERKEDIAALLEYFIEKYNNVYKKYVVLTEGSKAVICDYPWYGNVRQLESFCERITILAPKKVLNEEFINENLECYNINFEEKRYDESSIGKKVVVYENPEADKIL